MFWRFSKRNAHLWSKFEITSIFVYNLIFEEFLSHFVNENVMSSADVGGLEAAALKRKERLAALREAKSKRAAGKDSDKPLPA